MHRLETGHYNGSSSPGGSRQGSGATEELATRICEQYHDLLAKKQAARGSAGHEAALPGADGAAKAAKAGASPASPRSKGALKAALTGAPPSPTKRGGGGAVLGPGHFAGPGYAAAMKQAAAVPMAGPDAGEAAASNGEH
jgi:hypothetical protein